MQKLYKLAFQRILNKIGADKVDNLTLESLKNLLNQKNIPLSEIDQTIFHKIPREELKNLLRNPCPITNPQQISTELVTSAKAVRGALNIVEKRICFKCPFVSTCDKAFLEPPTDFKIQNPLPNLLLTMKYASQLQNNDIYKPRSWFSGVRICDSMNSVLDDLMQGAEQFKIFKQERNTLKDEAQNQNQKKQKINEKQLIRQAKKQKIPLKDIYAQIPSSNKQKSNPQKQGEEAFEQLSKGPQNIFKKKKSQQFIKIAQKYLNEQKVEKNQKQKGQRKQKKHEKRNRNSYQQNQGQQQGSYRRENKRQMRGGQRQRFTKGKQTLRRQNNLRDENNYREERNFRQQNNRRFDNKQKNKNYRNQDNQNYDNERYQTRRNDRNRQQPTRNDNQRNYQQNNRKRDYSQQEQSNPRIKRFSKEKPSQNRNYQQSQEQVTSPKRNNKLDKFFSQINEQKSDEEEILSSFNKRQSQSKSTRLPRDANERNQERRGSSMEFSQKEMREFDRLEKIPKILRTQFASKQDIQERQQQSSQEEVNTERKGRRVRRS